MRYKLHSNTNVYHTLTCKYAVKLRARCEITEEEVKARSDIRPCGLCLSPSQIERIARQRETVRRQNEQRLAAQADRLNRPLPDEITPEDRVTAAKQAKVYAAMMLHMAPAEVGRKAGVADFTALINGSGLTDHDMERLATFFGITVPQLAHLNWADWKAAIAKNLETD